MGALESALLFLTTPLTTSTDRRDYEAGHGPATRGVVGRLVRRCRALPVGGRWGCVDAVEGGADPVVEDFAARPASGVTGPARGTCHDHFANNSNRLEKP